MFEKLTEAAAKILAGQAGSIDDAVKWERPQSAEHGDLATSIALRLAKKVGRSPREIAQALADGLHDAPGVEKAEVAGPGYVNVWLTPKALLEAAQMALDGLSAVSTRNEAPVIVEYSQPNIAKPLGIHHILSTVIGQSVSNLYEHAGYPVIRWNYLGDWGTQFGKLAVAMEKWGAGKAPADVGMDGLLKLYVRFHTEAEADTSLEDAAREAFHKLEDGDAAMHEFWQKVVDVTKASLAPVYERLHVRFDLDLGESFYSDKMEPVIQAGIASHVFHEGDGGALIAEFSAESALPPFMIRKSDGATLYSTRDLAQMRYRMDTYHPQKVLYVVDTAQSLHFRQLFATAEQLKWPVDGLAHVVFGRMRFADGSMSTRKGNILRLADVLDEAVARAAKIIEERGEAIQTDDPAELAEMMGIGALVYSILSQNRTMDIVFDWEKALSFEGNSAPYLQYTHARARSVLRKADAEHAAFPADIASCDAHDRALINELLEFPGALEAARTTHMPHTLANYLYGLCQRFNAFYNASPILKSEGDTRALRLALADATARILRTGAELLTLRVPDRM